MKNDTYAKFMILEHLYAEISPVLTKTLLEAVQFKGLEMTENGQIVILTTLLCL